MNPDLKVVIEVVTSPDGENVEVTSRVENGEYDPEHPTCAMADRMLQLYGDWVNSVMSAFKEGHA